MLWFWDMWRCGQMPRTSGTCKETDGVFRSPITPRFRRLGVGLLLLIVTLLAVQPLLKGALPWSADGLLHFHRLAQLDRSLRHGILLPRWAPDMGFGFGFPLFNYYAPLSYYLAEPLHLLGLGHQTALLAAFVLAVFAASIGAYLLGRDLFGARAGFITAVAYAYAPYLLFNVIHRGALAEAWGLAWLPFTFWAVRRLAVYGRRTDLALTSLLYAALLLTHNILALISTPLLILYAVALWGLRIREGPQARLPRDGRRPPYLSLHLVGALALGLGLAAFFWVPAFFERGYVQIHQLYAPANLDYRNNFITLRELLTAPRPVDPALINASIPHSFGWPQVALALVALLGARRIDRREERGLASQAWHLALLGLGLLMLTAMMFPLSSSLWAMLPLLRFVQFPWRFLGPTSLFLAILAGAGVKRLYVGLHRNHDRLFLPLIVALMMIFALTWLFPDYYPAQPKPNPVRLISFEKETGALGTTSAGDYLPIWVREVPPADRLLPVYREAGSDFIIPRLARASLPSGARVLEARYGLTTAELVVETPVDFTATFNWYFFPGWHAELDGRTERLYPVGDYGLLGVDVPAGRHRLQISFGATPLRRWASIVSIASLIMLLIGLGLWRGGKEPQSSGKRDRSHSSAQRLKAGIDGIPWAPCAAVALILFGLKSLYLDRHETVLRRTRFDGASVAGVQTPLQVNFGDQLVLLGYDLESTADVPSAAVRADGLLELNLYWKAAQLLNADYSVAVHLVDDQGRRYGQDDSQHPGGYPTSRWELDTYARDQHRLAPWSGTPPGEYTLLIGVYDVTTGDHLEVRDAGGSPLGTAYSLADVQVTHCARPIDPGNGALEMGREVKADLSDTVRLLGFDPPPSELEAGGRLPLTLYWQATTRPTVDYRARLSLVGPDGARVAEERSVPGRASYPTSAWRGGDVVRDGRSLLVPATVPSDDYDLTVELLNEEGKLLEESAVLMDVSVRAPKRSFEVPAMQHAISATLGNQVSLLGYALSDEEVAPGRSFTVTLTWRAEATAMGDVSTSTGYVVFVHLLDQEGQICAQSDRVPAQGTRPTTGWVTGEVIRDSHRLTLPADAPAGRYVLEVGMYDPADGERLRARDEQGEDLGDRILLPTPVQVR
jgi:hypothetical protein